VLFRSPLYAETLYVRPGSGHGTSDGSSYTNAFDDFEDMVWGAGAGAISAGDTLKVCSTAAAPFQTVVLQAKLDGTASNYITIDGDCSANGDASKAVIDARTNHLSDTNHLVNNRWEYYGGATNTGYTYLIWKNLELIIESGGTRQYGGWRIYGTTAGVVDRAVEVFNTLDNVLVYSIGSASTQALQACAAFLASRVIVKNSTIHTCATEGIYAEGNSNELYNLYIYDVDVQTGTPDGDAVQFGDGAGHQNTNNWIHGNVLDARGNRAKQALIVSGDSDLSMNNLIENNDLYGGGAVLNFNPSGGTIKNNRLYTTFGGQNDPRGVINIENQRGTNLGNNTLTFYGNLIVGESGIYPYCVFGEPTGINGAHPYVITFVNNTCVGFTTTGIRLAASPLTVTVSNNILITASATQCFSFGSATTTTRKNNLWNGCTAKDQGGGAADNSTGDLHIDPLLVNPSTAVGTYSCCGGVAMPGVATGSAIRGDHQTKATSLARLAGATGALCIDVRGRPCWNPPDIGAYQATSGSQATQRRPRL